MSYGGYWGRLGMQFEDLWGLRQLVLMTSPSSDIESLEREPVGDDERGIDLWINRKNGIRECHQCKRANGNRALWSMASLQKEKIVQRLHFQIDRDPKRHQYCFVSGIPAPHFQRLCEEARDSRDARTFLESQVGPAKLNGELSEFCAALNLRICEPADRQIVWSLLRSSSFKLFRDDEDQLRELTDRFGSRVDGDPLTLLLALESWLRRQLRRKIDVEAVALFLESRGHKLIRGETDKFLVASRDLTRKRHQAGSLLKLQAEVGLLQAHISRRAGEQIQVLAGRWRLFRQIGRGGFAEVWQGEDLSLPEPERVPVAVKLLLADKAGDRLLIERFQQGGRTAAGILDFRIQKVRVEPSEADGRHFYVMEYVEGKNLGDWLSGGTLPLPGPLEFVARGELAYSQAAWNILASVGGALSVMHNKNLVHGDVKPTNILVSPSGMVKLCDFDLVHIPRAPREEDLVALGTLPYLAPEVLRGEGATFFSDQYSLAMTIVSMIRGADLLREAPLHMATTLLQSLVCSASVKENLTRALAPEAQRRFETVEAFMNNLGPEIFEATAL